MDSTNFQTDLNASTSKIISIVGKQNILGEASIVQEPQNNEGDSLQEKERSEEIEVSDSEQGQAPQVDLQEREKLQFSDLEFEQSQDEEEQTINDQDEVDKLEKQNVDFALEEEECLDDEEQGKKEHEIKSKAPVRSISLRSFQATLVQNSRDKNSIIYLPTGTGKTRISICSMYYYLCKFGTAKKIVFLANTIQLVKQQAEAIKATLTSIIQNESFAKDLRQKLGDNYVHLPWKVEDIQTQVVCIHGQKNEDQTQTKRKRIQSMMTTRKQFLNEMKKATITAMISQMFLNCLRRGYIKITDYSFIVFDECHHCTGDHPYAGIMKQFYFQQKKKNKKLQDMNRLEDKDRLPIIMGLTASPVSQPFKEYSKLKAQLRTLCVNLDSNFTPYPFENMIIGETQIEIKQIKQTQQRQLRVDLIEFLDKNKDHATSYAKIRTHFPEYFICVKEVITLMASRHQNLAIDVDGSRITDPELYIFYDIKQCLLLKLRDLWLQLGQFAFMLGMHEMIVELTRLSGLRNAQNTILHKEILQILKRHQYLLASKYGKCTKSNFSTKVIELIDILKPSEEDLLNQKVTDMVLVFAFKRRTVKFLQLVLDKYRDQLDQKQKNFYKSVGVTGYASRQKIYRTEDGHSYQSNPSAVEDQAAVNKLYNDFVQTEREFRTNKMQLQTSLLGDVKENKALTSQMTRMYYSKMGKMLLEVQQKYSNQINKIMSFKRREQRVLITTSVTEQGFDIPGCNLVISFDTPFSLKSYIQIKGRARKKNSKYIIFTNEKSYKNMVEYKSIYDNTIRAIFELAINQISHETINAMEHIKYSPSYKKIGTKGGALLNTNYALDLLKSYFTCLKPPNRAYIHFIQTNNICFRCIIKFPQTSTFNQSYVVGKPFASKLEALRSAAYQAVVLLKKQNFMRQDLRPSRLQQLQDQLQLEKYDDLGMYHKDDHYKEIFNQYVQIQCDEDPNTKKKLVRFYFKSLQLQQLEFYILNPEFSLKKFQADQQQIFQIYQIKFSNHSNHLLLQQNEDTNEVGILTSFSKQETEEIFAGFRKNMQLTSPETFQLKLIKQQLKLTITDYNYLKGIHTFLISGQKNNQVDYYNSINGSPPVLNPNWIYKQDKKLTLKIDNKRQYFPLLVLLKKNKKDYEIDDGANKAIEKHIDIFKKLYSYHNKVSKYIPDKPFQQSLKYQYQVLTDKLNKIEGKKYLLQSISKDFCFHKGFLSTKMAVYDQKLEAQEDKKKGKLIKKYQRMKKTFMHFREQKSIYTEKIIKLETWKQASKDDINSILSKNSKMKITQQAKGLNRFLKEFILYPVTYPTMVKISLAAKYVFQVFQDYSIALYFRKYYLRDIFNEKQKKITASDKYAYKFYKNIIGENFQKILRHIQGAGKSKYVRQLGRECFNTLKRFVNVIDPSNQSINLSNLNQSSIIMGKSNMNALDQSSFNHNISNLNISLNQSVNHQIDNNFPEIKAQAMAKEKVSINVNLLSSLKIDDILRSITSKIYNHQKSENYEEFEFIGDVVLKFLATIQIFIEKVNAQQGEMHIARANLICNANLHRAAIKKKLFLYTFTTKKKSEPAPFVRVYKGQKKESQKQRYNATEINILGSNDEDDGYQYIPGKVHADVMQSLIGIFYLKNKNLNDCQSLLYCFDILKMPTIAINFVQNDHSLYEVPDCLSRLEARLSYQFKHKGLLIQALTHPSFLQYIEDAIDQNNSFNRLLNESKMSESKSFAVMSDTSFTGIPKIKTQQTFYQRLQFLGDAFLDLLVVQFLYDRGEKYINDQGTLSFLKQSAVSNKTLGFIALKLGLHQSVFMNLDDVDSTITQFRLLNKQLKEFPNPIQFAKLKLGSLKILGDVFESLVGAILIDNYFNYQNTKAVIMKVIQPYVKHFTDFSFVEQSPSYKCKEYLDQNNYKTIKVNKINEEDKIINGEYLYQFSDKTGNKIGLEIRACNEKDAWDKFIEVQTEQKK